MYKNILLGLSLLQFSFFAHAQEGGTEPKTKWQNGMTPAQQLIANTGEDLIFWPTAMNGAHHSYGA